MRLIDITKKNWEDIIMLTTNEEGVHYLGEEFVASNAYSLLECIYEEGWTARGIEINNILIGFVMYGLNTEENVYEICRFMIDRRYQGKGYGKQALKVIVDEMQKEFSCKEIYLSVDSKNLRGKHIYEKAGFKATGELWDDEEVYKIII